jgi:hypothetical protein
MRCNGGAEGGRRRVGDDILLVHLEIQGERRAAWADG